MSLTRTEIIDNIKAMMLANLSVLDGEAARTAFAEEIADSIIDGSISPYGPYMVGSRQSFGETFAIPASQTLTANRIYGQVYRIKTAVKVDNPRLRFTSSVAGSAVIGIYKYDDVADIWDKVVQSDPTTQFDTSVTTTQEKELTAPTTLQPGKYATVIHSSTAPTMWMTIFYGVDSTILGYAADISSTPYLNVVTHNATYNATLPNQLAFSYAASGYAPLITLEVQSA